MLYDVYVTRAAQHFEGAQVPISEGDWRTIIDNDPDLRAPDEAYPSYAVWAGRARPGPNWIDWADGNLFTRNPDDSMLRKLIELAELLGARVQGDRGEHYRFEEGEVVRVERASGTVGPESAGSAESAGSSDRPQSGGARDRAEPRPPVEPAGSAPPAARGPAPILGPRPRNAEPALEIEADGLELHADASFARAPEDLLAGEKAEAAAAALPFRVGQRVRTDWGRPGTITSIDLRAKGGLGEIQIRYDDGRVATTSCVSHGLEPLGG